MQIFNLKYLLLVQGGAGSQGWQYCYQNDEGACQFWEAVKLAAFCDWTSSQAPSYASPKLWLTDLLTGVKCRATSVAKNDASHSLYKLSPLCLWQCTAVFLFSDFQYFFKSHLYFISIKNNTICFTCLVRFLDYWACWHSIQAVPDLYGATKGHFGAKRSLLGSLAAQRNFFSHIFPVGAPMESDKGLRSFSSSNIMV